MLPWSSSCVELCISLRQYSCVVTGIFFNSFFTEVKSNLIQNHIIFLVGLKSFYFFDKILGAKVFLQTLSTIRPLCPSTNPSLFEGSLHFQGTCRCQDGSARLCHGNRPSSEHKIQTKLLLANPYANIEGQRIVVIPQQCKQRRTL